MSIDPLAMAKMPSNFLKRQKETAGNVEDGGRFWVTQAAGDVRYVQRQGGLTAERPLVPILYQYFFDTTLGIPIFYDGTNWVDATGATV